MVGAVSFLISALPRFWGSGRGFGGDGEAGRGVTQGCKVEGWQIGGWASWGEAAGAFGACGKRGTKEGSGAGAFGAFKRVFVATPSSGGGLSRAGGCGTATGDTDTGDTATGAAAPTPPGSPRPPQKAASFLLPPLPPSLLAIRAHRSPAEGWGWGWGGDRGCWGPAGTKLSPEPGAEHRAPPRQPPPGLRAAPLCPQGRERGERRKAAALRQRGAAEPRELRWERSPQPGR